MSVASNHNGLPSRITFKAIPYPLAAGVAKPLIEAGKRTGNARRAVDLIKEGCSPQKDAAIAEYERAVAELLSVEAMIRRTHGVDHCRPEFFAKGL